MKECKSINTAVFLNLIAVLLLAPSAWGRSRNINSLFEYVAGTESISTGCEGKLDITDAALVYQCPEGSITVPYNSITAMEYRPRVSKEIRKMKLNWTVKPPSSHSKHQAYFSVLYSEKGQTHAIILKTSPETMRPYLAEIGLRTGRTIHSRKY